MHMHVMQTERGSDMASRLRRPSRPLLACQPSSKAEVKRKKLDAIYNAGALKGSNIISAPWE